MLHSQVILKVRQWKLSILLTYPSGTSLSSTTFGSCVALAIAGSTSTMLTIDLFNLKD